MAQGTVDTETVEKIRKAEADLKEIFQNELFVEGAKAIEAFWKANVGTHGHKTLARLLVGTSSDAIIERKSRVKVEA